MDNKGLSLTGGPFLLVLVLVSSLLLCKNVTSMPACPSGAVNCEVPLGDLFDRAVILSHYIHNLSSEMFHEFNKQYAQDRGFITMVFNGCHTSSIPTPEDKKQAQKMRHEDLLNLILRVLHSWSEPLNHLVTEMRAIQKAPGTQEAAGNQETFAMQEAFSTQEALGTQEAPNDILSRAIEIQVRNKQLLEGMEKIINQVQHGVRRKVAPSPWLGLPSLQGADEYTRLLAFYELIHCLRRDSHKIDNYLKVLKCRIIYDSSC